MLGIAGTRQRKKEKADAPEKTIGFHYAASCGDETYRLKLVSPVALFAAPPWTRHSDSNVSLPFLHWSTFPWSNWIRIVDGCPEPPSTFGQLVQRSQTISFTHSQLGPEQDKAYSKGASTGRSTLSSLLAARRRAAVAFASVTF